MLELDTPRALPMRGWYAPRPSMAEQQRARSMIAEHASFNGSCSLVEALAPRRDGVPTLAGKGHGAKAVADCRCACNHSLDAHEGIVPPWLRVSAKRVPETAGKQEPPDASKYLQQSAGLMAEQLPVASARGASRRVEKASSLGAELTCTRIPTAHSIAVAAQSNSSQYLSPATSFCGDEMRGSSSMPLPRAHAPPEAGVLARRAVADADWLPLHESCASESARRTKE